MNCAHWSSAASVQLVVLQPRHASHLARGHTDLVGAAIVADHGAHRVRAMTVIIRRSSRMLAVRVPPVVVVVEAAAAQVAAVV